MSFTGDVKTELCEAALSEALEKVFRYGVLYGLNAGRPVILTENAAVKSRLCALFSDGLTEDKRRKDEKELYRLSFLCKLPEDGIPDRTLLKGDDVTTGVFLRGVFLSCGTVSVQKAGYHLELALHTEEKCGALLRLINEQGMSIKSSSRRGTPFLYTKNSENIADILTFIGAMSSAMEIMNIKIYKDVRSGVNRAVNCEAANLGKTVAASAGQIAHIKLIESRIGLDKLPPELRELAAARLENPDISLSELGKLLSPKISRSGVNHRLERIKKIAEELENNEKG